MSDDNSILRERLEEKDLKNLDDLCRPITVLEMMREHDNDEKDLEKGLEKGIEKGITRRVSSDRKSDSPRSRIVKWNDEVETILKKIVSDCDKYKNINFAISQSLSNKRDIIIYLILILGPLTGIFAALSRGSENEVLDIFVIILPFFIGGLSGALKTSKFEQRSVQHKAFGVKFFSIETDIRRQLQLERNDRVNPSIYFDWITSSYDNLYATMPLIQEKPHEGSKEVHAEKNSQKDPTNPPSFDDGKLKYELARLKGLK